MRQPGAEPLILDNLITEVRPASRRPDLVPVFSFNSEGLWQGVGRRRRRATRRRACRAGARCLRRRVRKGSNELHENEETACR